MSIGNVQLLQDYLPDVAVQAVEYRNVYRGHASRRTANRPARSAYRRRSVLSKFVLNSWCSVRNARSLVNEVGWMADEKMSEGSAVECLDTQSAMLVLAFVLALLTFTGLIRPWHILVLAFLLGIANTFDTPARYALVDQLVDDKRHLPNALALNGSMFNMATALGPAAAGAVYALLGPAWCFTINGLSFVAVIAALLFMHLRPVPLCPRGQSPMAGIVEGLRYVWRHENIRTLILLMGITSLFGLSFAALIPAWAVKMLHGTATTGATINGLLQSARGVGALLAALTIATVSHLKIKGRIATFGTFAYPVALLAFAVARSTALALPLMALVGFASFLVVNLCNVLIQSQVEDSLRGRVIAIYSLVYFGMMPIGSLLTGWLAQWASEPVAIIVSAFAALTGAVLIWMLVPRLRAMP